MDNTKAAESKHGLTDEGIIPVPGLLSRWVRLPNGAKAHYVTAGESGPAVVLLHGGLEGSSGTAGFRLMCGMLAASGFRVYAPDRPGFGLADISKREYLDFRPHAQVEFLRAFADALCLETFHVSGNSSGCMVACDFVISHPERVLSVAFIAGALGDITDEPRWIPSTQGRFTPKPDYQFAPWDGTEEGMRTLMAGIIHRPAEIPADLIAMRVYAGLIQREARIAAGLPVRQMAWETDPNLLQVFSTKNRLDRMTIPMIYLYGLQDVLMTVENGFRQEDSVSNIQFFYPDECGHQGQTDQPEMFNQVLLEFFRDGRVSWQTAEWAGVSRRRPINARFVAQPDGGFPLPVPNAYSDLATLRRALGAPRAAA